MYLHQSNKSSNLSLWLPPNSVLVQWCRYGGILGLPHSTDSSTRRVSSGGDEYPPWFTPDHCNDSRFPQCECV